MFNLRYEHTKKVINGGLIIYVGGQILVVAAGLVHHYSSQHEITPPIDLTVKTQQYSLQDILHGAITKPQLNYPADTKNSTKEFSITLIASTTGTSTDCTLVFPI